MIDKSVLLSHYKRDDIQQAILTNGSKREVVARFGEGFGQRPDVLSHPGDILELAKQGATSFHASEEHWSNPLHLSPSMTRRDLDGLRTGWDLLLDVDCLFLDYSQIAAELLLDALKHHGIRSATVKFSGNHGFHIGVPFRAFPPKVQGKETHLLFPEGPRRIALYLKEVIKDSLGARLLEHNPINTIMERSGKPFQDLVKKNIFDPFSVLTLDTVLISSRHLYRMPYCFNEKSGLVSYVLDDLSSFSLENAKPTNMIVTQTVFLDDRKCDDGEASKLIVQAFDFLPQQEEEFKPKKEFTEFVGEVPPELFPPCIHHILKGMDDGKKRSLFILINFLTSIGWSYDSIETFLREWNKKNNEPLREQSIVGQIRYHKQQKKKILPPNCDNTMYYKDLHICTPDSFCSRIKNPANYSILKAKSIQRENSKRKKKES